MRHRLTAGICSLAIAWMCASNACADVFGDISVIPEPDDSGNRVMHGYVEHRFHIVNNSLSRSHSIALVMPNRSYGSSGTIRKIKREVTVAPGNQVTMSLSQLPLYISGDGHVAVFVDGSQKGSITARSANFGRNYYENNDDLPRLLLSRSIAASAFADTAATNYLRSLTNSHEHAAPAYGHGISSALSSSKLAEPFHSQLDPQHWREDWLAYSCYDCIVASDSDLKQMSQTTKLALLRYAECGGSLFVGGSFEIPSPWDRHPVELGPGLKGFHMGFGHCVLATDATMQNLSAEQLRNLRRIWLKSLRPWQSPRDPVQANQAFPVVDNISLPLRTLFALMVGFAIAIWINLFVLYRIKRQIWVLWTVPLISGCAAAIVIGYAFLSEGITPTVRIEGVTILDQYQHRATTLGFASYYCPITPASGLRFDYSSELTPLIETEWHAQRSSPLKSVDLSRDQHLESGWISARAPSLFMTRKSEPRRERLEIRQLDPNTLSVVNGIGANIDKLWVADTNGRLFSSGAKIPAGKQALLAPAPGFGKAGNDMEWLNRFYESGDWQVTGLCPSNDPSGLLLPGTYVAFLDSSPFMEKGLGRRSHDKFRSAVIGFWALQ